MILAPQYGFRSECCYAPIKLGRKKIKNTTLKVDIWVCCKCGRRDISLIQYDGKKAPKPSTKKLVFVTDEKSEEI